MLLARIKEALSGQYENIEEPAGATEAEAAESEVAEEAAEVSADAAAAEEAAAETEGAPQPEEAEEPTETAPPGPKESDYKAKGYHLNVELPADQVVAAVEILNREKFFLEAITGVDWIDDNQLEAVYDFNHYDELCRVVIRTRLDRSNPEVPTISHIFQGANWHERETHDFFGIVFTGHIQILNRFFCRKMLISIHC